MPYHAIPHARLRPSALGRAIQADMDSVFHEIIQGHVPVHRREYSNRSSAVGSVVVVMKQVFN